MNRPPRAVGPLSARNSAVILAGTKCSSACARTKPDEHPVEVGLSGRVVGTVIGRSQEQGRDPVIWCNGHNLVIGDPNTGDGEGNRPLVADLLSTDSGRGVGVDRVHREAAAHMQMALDGQSAVDESFELVIRLRHPACQELVARDCSSSRASSLA